MKFLSVCSGIEAASVAWKELGWKALGFSEIEKYPSELLAYHYPDVPNYGDMNTLSERILDGEIESPDLLCGGTPCQAFSVAGRRESLDDERGNLTLTFCEIANAIDRVREISGQQPAIVFWENVPGVLNTKDNAFGCFLGELSGETCELEPPGGKWKNAGLIVGPKRTVAWRILDAQYFGVAQRRRRVFVIASAREKFNPAEILFEFEGLRRDIAPSRSSGKSATAATETSVGTSDNNGNAVITMAHGQAGAEIAFDRGPTLTCNHEAPIVCQPVAYNITFCDSNGTRQDRPNGGLYVSEVDVANTITTAGVGTNIVQPTVYEMHGQDSRVKDVGDTCPTITSKYGTGGGNVPIVLDEERFDIAHTFKIRGGCEGGGKGYLGQDEATFTISTHQDQHLYYNMTVRRLTPVECERLQGFPDNYTKINEKTADSHRYKALGNSWAVPVVRWIGKRIDNYVRGYPVEVLDDPLFL